MNHTQWLLYAWSAFSVNCYIIVAFCLFYFVPGELGERIGGVVKGYNSVFEEEKNDE